MLFNDRSTFLLLLLRSFREGRAGKVCSLSFPSIICVFDSSGDLIRCCQVYGRLQSHSVSHCDHALHGNQSLLLQLNVRSTRSVQIGNNLTDYEFLFIDLGLITLLVLLCKIVEFRRSSRRTVRLFSQSNGVLPVFGSETTAHETDLLVNKSSSSFLLRRVPMNGKFDLLFN